MQEITGLRLSYLSLTMSAALLFVHNNEFNQMESDDEMQKQRSLLMTDAMTGLKSRYAYSELLNQSNRKVLSKSVTVFMIDINGLKATNDALGHLAGDELIVGMARCISDTFSPFGECFRTGGDEFVVILETDDGRGPELSHSLEKRVREWKGSFSETASLSYGFASTSEYPDSTMEKLISIADKRMYEQKDLYYIQSGRQRRNR